MKKNFLLAVVLVLVLSGCGGNAGPASIDLSDPAMYVHDAYPDYRLNMEIKSEGVDMTGAQKTFILSYDIENQTDPKAQHITMAGEGASGTVELVILDDQVMSVNPDGSCSIFPVSAMEGQNPEDTIPKIDTLLTGNAKRVKTGVKVEGITTDQYEITTANMTNPGSSATPNITDGSVYVARDGGYIARVELTGKLNSGQNGFNPNVESQITLNYTFVPVKGGTLEIAAPAECEDQLAGGGAYPLMDGAAGLVSTPNMLYYTVDAPLDEALNFYRTRMAEDGWTIKSDTGGNSDAFANIEFVKGNEGVAVNFMAQGERLTITLQPK